MQTEHFLLLLLHIKSLQPVKKKTWAAFILKQPQETQRICHWGYFDANAIVHQKCVHNTTFSAFVLTVDLFYDPLGCPRSYGADYWLQRLWFESSWGPLLNFILYLTFLPSFLVISLLLTLIKASNAPKTCYMFDPVVVWKTTCLFGCAVSTCTSCSSVVIRTKKLLSECWNWI